MIFLVRCYSPTIHVSHIYLPITTEIVAVPAVTLSCATVQQYSTDLNTDASLAHLSRHLIGIRRDTVVDNEKPDLRRADMGDRSVVSILLFPCLPQCGIVIID